MKPHLVSVLLGIAAPALAGPTITVTAPRAGAHWCLGQTYRVTWSSPGTSENVAIQLARSRAPVRTLVAETKDDGIEDVTVPSTLEPGAYVVRVRTLKRPVIVGESREVVIDACLALAPPALTLAPSIQVTGPAAGSRFVLGNVLPVRWISTGPVPDTPLTITLQTPRCGREVRLLSAATANDGEESFTAPSDLSEGDYAVQVGIAGGRVKGCSATFRLAEIVSILEPSRSTVAHPGDRVMVRWQSSLGGNLKLALSADGSPCVAATPLASSTPNDGEAVVVIPAATTPGLYRITATPLDSRWGDTCFASEPFRVVAR